MFVNKLSNLNNNAANANFAAQKNPSFSGTEALGKKILNAKNLKKFSDSFEYNKFQMSITAMMCILYGATIVPRFCQATDKHDRREILIRDVTSITAILFCAKALGKGLSRLFTKSSGFALLNLPHAKKQVNVLDTFAHYLNPVTGSDKAVNVLTSAELTSKYSKLENYKDGIQGFFKFIEHGKGNIGKVLASNKVVRENSNKILGKDVLKSKSGEIKAAFEKAKDSQEMKNIYGVFAKTDNSYVKKAKTMNSYFDFMATLILTPGLMIGIEKFNEHNTKRILAKEQAKKDAKAKAQNA